jgi:hypothetical protein
MSYTLTMSGVIVGRSDLEVRDADRRVARGVFRPGLGYELAQPVFDLKHEANGDPEMLERYRRARDALRLQLTDAAGAVIEVSELHIRREPSAASEYVIEVRSNAPELWRGNGE